MKLKICEHELNDTIPRLVGFRNSRAKATASIFLKVLDKVDFTKRSEQVISIDKKEIDVEGIASLAEPFYYTYESKEESFVIAPFSEVFTSADTLFLTINRRAYPFLKALKQYKENYDLVGMMTSAYKYTNIIYAFLQDQLKVNPSGFIDIELDKLRAMCNVEEGYKLFTNFKQRVLTPAVKDIMSIANWDISLVFNRGYFHEISEISFIIKQK